MSEKSPISKQKEERARILKSIISSTANRKIIVAGAGTGKTYTLKEVLRANPKGKNIAMTFIRKLTNDMEMSLGKLAEVKTFHAYCKKVLHEQNGKVELIPFLTTIIQEDADYLELELNDFDFKFQTLDEKSDEIAFYLKRGDYYDAVSFNDSVYRLYKKLRTNAGIIPNFNQILIDEYQDFNPLEVSFIDELEKKGNILIIGDDDQAVYDGRAASPKHLREKYYSGKYAKFTLPFCSRCTNVIVDAIKVLLANAEKNGLLRNRVQKEYECYLELKKEDNKRFPQIITAQCSTCKVVASFIDHIIKKIDKRDIEESWKANNEYPTVLIVGHKQYLTIIYKQLAEKYPQIVHKLSEDITTRLVNAYDLLLKDENNNLGWRILLKFFVQEPDIKNIIKKSRDGNKIVDLLDDQFISKQLRALEIIRSIQRGEKPTAKIKSELRAIVDKYYDELNQYYSPKDRETEKKPDKSKPSILLSSFVGCKGLSAGYVIVVGANNGSIPRDPKNIRDIEVSQFVVALTRTRKQCHIVSNKWLISPSTETANAKSTFINWMPQEYLEDRGYLIAKDIS